MKKVLRSLLKQGFTKNQIRNADLSRADLSRADLSGADLRGADLSWAELSGAKIEKNSVDEYTAFFSISCPEYGAFIGWKKANEKIIKLQITENALRSSATSLKCRCSEALVLEIQELDGRNANIESISSNYDNGFVYTVGKIVEVDNFDNNRWNECSTGIHFFMNRLNAVNY